MTLRLILDENLPQAAEELPDGDVGTVTRLSAPLLLIAVLAGWWRGLFARVSARERRDVTR